MQGELLGAVDPGITAALVAAGVSLATAFLTKLWLDRRAHEEDLEADHRLEQRKALLQLIARYHGGLVEHATSWNYRMANMFANVEKGWLGVGGDYRGRHYYIDSTVHRWLALLALAQRFEAEEIFIDARYVEAHELEFVKFAKAFHWVMSDAGLFDGLTYDPFSGQDHFTSDRLRATCEAFVLSDRVPSFRQFESAVSTRAKLAEELQPAFQFFDGLTRSEDRLRWDRLVCLHLLTLAFVTSFGYEWQRPSAEFIRTSMEQACHKETLANFVAWLPRLGLDQQACLQTVVAHLEDMTRRS